MTTNAIKNINTQVLPQPIRYLPDQNGFFGNYGGQFIPPELKPKFDQLTEQFYSILDDEDFLRELTDLLVNYVGRPSPLYLARRLSEHLKSLIYLKREDLNHTGAHKINNTIGQILMARRMGYREIIAETGAGQHGVATATAAALMGMECKIFMGRKDYQRQFLNVKRMEMLGAEVIAVEQGNGSLKDAVDAALGYFIENPKAYYLIGSVVGPHPYPTIVRFFQSVIGSEARQQILIHENSLPDYVFAAIGGGSNAIGIFSAFIDDQQVSLIAGEGAGLGIDNEKNAATLNLGEEMIFQGMRTLTLTDTQGNPRPSYSIAAGLDYPGIGPEHAHLRDTGRVKYLPITDDQATQAFKILARLEGIIPAMESAHGVAAAIQTLKGNPGKLAIINISGRGDKDVERIK